MKTSYQLLILAAFILFGTTAAYDIALNREYSKTDHNDPYSDYDQLNFKNFDKIEILGSNRIATTIIYGPKFDVKQLKFMEDVLIEQKGSTLIITFNSESNSYQGGSGNDFIIKCPSLKQITADFIYTSNGMPVATLDSKSDRYYGGRVSVNGFKQDSLYVIMNNSTTVLLQNNNLNFLDANIGGRDLTRSTIDIDGTNSISSAQLNLQHQSVMTLRNIYINNFKYKLSDSAQVNLSGISLQLLSKK